MAEQQEILFGTGELFVVPPGTDLSTATELDLTKVGESSGEATLKVENEFLDVRGGSKNQLLKSFVTSETVTFNAGVVTYDLQRINDFVAGYYSEDTTAGTRTLGIGGKKTVPIKQLRFIHTKEDGKKITIDMYKAQNRSGLEWSFNNEENSPFSFEFTLLKDDMQSDGNIVKITEEI